MAGRPVARVCHGPVRNTWAVGRVPWEAWRTVAHGRPWGWVGRGGRGGSSHGLLAMCLEMFEHVVLSDEPFATLLTRERFFARVEAHVAAQISLMVKLLGADLTLVRLVSRMLALVVVKRKLVWETFATSSALEGLLAFVVGGAVLRQVTHSVKQLATVLTPVGALADAAAGATRFAGVHGRLRAGVATRGLWRTGATHPAIIVKFKTTEAIKALPGVFIHGMKPRALVAPLRLITTKVVVPATGVERGTSHGRRRLATKSCWVGAEVAVV